MMEAIVVFCTCSSETEGKRIAEDLVEEGLAACVNMLPGIESIYRWQGKVERAKEVLLLIKTTKEAFLALEKRLVKLHSYDTPEIIGAPIVVGSESYLQWIEAQVRRR